MPPDQVHHNMVRLAFGASKSPFLIAAGKKWLHHTPDGSLEQELFGLSFKNPVGLAAGIDKNGQMTHMMDMVGAGFSTVGSVTYEPRKGNPRPWYHRLPKTKSIVVYAGLGNEGLLKIAPRLENRPQNLPIVVNVPVVAQKKNDDDKTMINDVKKAISYIIEKNLGDMIEVNISCPNVKDNEPFSEPARLEKLLTVLDGMKLSKPLTLKMPSRRDWKRFEPIVDVALRHNVQALTIANLSHERDLVSDEDNLTDDIKGGISGAPCRAQSTELIRKTYAKCGDQLKIIGLGGVFGAEDAYEKICAGASLVEMATGIIFEGPAIVGMINAELEGLLKQDGFSSIQQAVGSKATSKN